MVSCYLLCDLACVGFEQVKGLKAVLILALFIYRIDYYKVDMRLDLTEDEAFFYQHKQVAGLYIVLEFL